MRAQVVAEEQVTPQLGTFLAADVEVMRGETRWLRECFPVRNPQIALVAIADTH